MSKSILITGGAQGLGWALAQWYRGQGHEVLVLDLEDREDNEGVVFKYCDISKFEASLLNDTSRPFDIVICNAGISVSGDYKEIPFEKEKNVFDVNVFGHMQLIKTLFDKDLIAQDANLAFVCSATKFLPFPIALAYAASKGALDGFAHALESYGVAKNVSVTRIFPGPMNTAHSQYYPGASTEGGRKPEQSVRSIVRGIQRRKRTVCPDPISRIYSVVSRWIPGYLCRKSYNFYKDRLV